MLLLSKPIPYPIKPSAVIRPSVAAAVAAGGTADVNSNPVNRYLVMAARFTMAENEKQEETCRFTGGR